MENTITIDSAKIAANINTLDAEDRAYVRNSMLTAVINDGTKSAAATVYEKLASLTTDSFVFGMTMIENIAVIEHALTARYKELKAQEKLGSEMKSFVKYEVEQLKDVYKHLFEKSVRAK